MKRNIINSKISIKLMLTIVLCCFLSVLTFFIGAYYLSFHYLADIESGNLMRTNYYNSLLLLLFIISICVFIVSFLLIINRNIKYIKYITKKVKRISNEDFGSTVEIRGNDELAELCMSINSMSIELKNKFDNERQMESVKNELITNISHDLRTPLTSIIGYVDLLRNKEYKSEEEFNEFVDVIYHKANNLKKLINELFEYTKLTSPDIKLNCSKIDLCALLEQMIGEYTPIFEREGLAIKMEMPKEDVIINIDIEKVVRLFENILMNALKYSSKPSDITIRLNRIGNKAIISIANRLDKPPAQDLNILFERFYRVEKSRKEVDGTGLGLAIAKRITELHKGRIWANYNNNVISFNVELTLDCYNKA